MKHICNRWCFQLLSALVLIVGDFFGYGAEAERVVTLQLKWQVQFQFAGYYAALEQGYYKEAGLDVNIIPGGPQISPIERVLEGKADFGISSPYIVAERAKGKPLVALAALFQHSPEVVVTLKSSGLTYPVDLRGKRVMTSKTGNYQVYAMLLREGVDLKDLKFQRYTGNLQDLIDGKTDAIETYLTTTPFWFRKKNIPINIISPVNYGLDFYGDVLFTTEKFAAQNPELAEKFIVASRKGWKYAFAHPVEVALMLQHNYGCKVALHDLIEEMEKMHQLVLPELIEIGHMNETRWQQIAQSYAALGIIEPGFDVKKMLFDPHRIREQFWLRIGTIIVLVAAGAALFAGILLFFNYRLKTVVGSRTRELRSSQQRLTAALDSSTDGIWDEGLNDNSIFISSHCLGILGYAGSRVFHTAEEWWALVHEEDRTLFRNSYQNVLSGDAERFTVEVRMRHANGTYRWICLQGKVYDHSINGHPKRVVGTARDVTDNKKSSQMLQQRLNQLTRPVLLEADISFETVFDLAVIQEIQDAFADATGVASIITSPDGVPITRPSCFTELCQGVIRTTSEGLRLCQHSDKVMTSGAGQKSVIAPCKSCGLMDGCSSIYAGNKHLANWLIGQVFTSNLDKGKIRSFAKVIGVDQDVFDRELEKVPRMPLERFEAIGKALALFAQQLSELAYTNVLQARSIHSRMLTEERMRENEALLKEAQTIGKVGHWRYFIAEDRFEVSEEAQRLTGFKPIISSETFLQAPLKGEDRQRLIRAWSDSIKRGSNISLSFRSDYDGKDKHLYLRGAVFGDADGNPEHLLGIVQDITERVKREQSLREKEENLRITLDAIGDGVISTDSEGNVVRMNPVAQELTGWGMDEAKGMPLNEVFRIFNAQSHEPILNPVEQVLSQGRVTQANGGTLLRSRDDVVRIIDDSASPIRNENNELVGAVLVFRDITGQHRMEEQLRQAQKMEAIGQLAGGVAHDFNNLLGGIMGYAELLSLKCSDNEETQNFASQIITTAERAARLTSQMLAFARKGKVISTPFDVHGVINEALDILRHSIDRKISIETILEAESSKVVGDPAQVQNAILNLGINARDAMASGGTLTMKTSNINLGEAYCSQSNFTLEPGDYILISVRDTGLGMDENVCSRIFEPFFTTKEVGQGTGLGLAAVFGTVTAHGGAITVRSVLGEGTEFEIYLPVESNMRSGEYSSPEPIVMEEGKGYTVLLVDDEEIIRNMGKALLSEVGYKVLLATNGREGVELFRKKKNDIDVVVLDMIMPEMDGLEAMNEILKIDPYAKVLFASGFVKDDKISQMFEQGAIGFVKKPYRQSELLDSLHSAVKIKMPVEEA